MVRFIQKVQTVNSDDTKWITLEATRSSSGIANLLKFWGRASRVVVRLVGAVEDDVKPRSQHLA
jgi:hypothetical protein